MDDNANELLCVLVWPLQRQQWVLLSNCLVGALPYSLSVMRTFPLCGVRVIHPAQYNLTRQPLWWPPNKIKINVTLVSPRSDWVGVYGVMSNQRQPQYTYNGLQRRCQPRPPIIYRVCGG